MPLRVPFYVGNISSANHNFVKKNCKSRQKSRLNSPKNHTCRWYDDTQPYKISCPNSTLFVRYKNDKFQARKMSIWFVRNLLFLYLTNEVEFEQYILQGCVSSYHLHVWFFAEYRRFFCRGLHEFSRRLWYVPKLDGTDSIFL